MQLSTVGFAFAGLDLSLQSQKIDPLSVRPADRVKDRERIEVVAPVSDLAVDDR